MNKPDKTHCVTIYDRKSLNLTGIIDVMSFDENTVMLNGDHGIISVEGENLHIQKMNIDSGEIFIEGKINGLLYIDKDTKKSGLFGKHK